MNATLNNRILPALYYFMQSELPVDMFHKTPHHGWTEEMRQFALTLHLYGPKAYEYARKFIPLPATRTLRT